MIFKSFKDSGAKPGEWRWAVEEHEMFYNIGKGTISRIKVFPVRITDTDMVWLCKEGSCTKPQKLFFFGDIIPVPPNIEVVT